MPEFLFEIRSEEIPAHMQRRAADQLRERLLAMTSEMGFFKDVGLDQVRTFVTPRRLVGVIDGLPAQQEDIEKSRKGPKVGAPEQAVQGFLKAAGLSSLDEASIEETPKGQVYMAHWLEKGRATADVLAEKLPELLAAFDWPKSMRWGNGAARWVRPLQGIVAVFDGRPLEGGFGLASLTDQPEHRFAFSDRTVGHRFLAPDDIQVTDFDSYRTALQEAFVEVDPQVREAQIQKDADALCAAEGLTLRPDKALVREVAGLVEWPVVLMGSIEPAFMDLPPEVMVTAMRSHQKYFAVEQGDNAGESKLAGRFCFVSNMLTKDDGAAIIAGNERVLSARLADAQFFWDQDRKISLADRISALANIVFHAKLGSLADKVSRLQSLAVHLAQSIEGVDRDRVRSAARLAKADLTTGMVGEFPELQGVMGRYYALHDQEHPDVAAAIAAHYSPLGPGDPCPAAPVSVAVALADKLDTLAGFWAIDEKPTGSKDPFALRRAALGVIRLILENGLRLPLAEALRHALEPYRQMGLVEGLKPLVEDLLQFFADRLKVVLREKGVRHDLISAVFALGDEDDLVRLLARVEALSGFLASDDGANLLVAYGRATNIVRIESKKDRSAFDQAVASSLLAEAEESALFEALEASGGDAALALKAEDFTAAMAAMASLRRPVDAFFDQVMVNSENPDLRANRLRLLSQIGATLSQVADFSKIEGVNR
ncbi:MAG: glycine--tRNA ligase subunit beta [Pseudomonadota bacterium]